MIRPCLLVMMTAGLLLAPAQGQNSPQDSKPTRLPLPPPPTPPARKAPTELFRELLATPAAGRDALLANRSSAARNLILIKLREFEALPPDQRELRLRVAELEFYLSPLLRAASEARPRLLATAPAAVRPLLEERLRAWEALTPDRQRDLLDSEQSLSFFVRLQVTSASALTNILREVPISRRSEVEAQLARWQALTPDQRAQKTADFQRFFELRAGEQDKVLRRISSAERVQMERTLAQFNQLPPEQRERAVRGFRRFLDMSPTERAGFLQNAAQWQSMTPSEREAWRRVVERAAHPTPVPMPPERARARGVAMTNLPSP